MHLRASLRKADGEDILIFLVLSILLFSSLGIQPVLDGPIIREVDYNMMRNARRYNCEPDICISFFSCNRPDYFRQTLTAFMSFIQKYEKDLCYELNWFDQATPNREQFSRMYNFDKRVFIAKKSGYAISFDTAFRMCQAKYILLMEEDWMIYPHVNWSVLSFMMDLLDNAPTEVYGITLRAKALLSKMAHYRVKSSTIGMTNLWAFVRTDDMFMNGGTLYRMSNIREMMKVDGAYLSEEQFSRIGKQKRWYHSYWEPDDNSKNAYNPEYWYPGFLYHIGKHSQDKTHDYVRPAYT